MFDHLGFAARDPAAARAFRDPTLAHLGLSVTRKRDGAIAGVRPRLRFDDRPNEAQTGIRLRAGTRTPVDAFYRVALAAAPRDNRMPGPRPHDTPACYGALVLYPDGHNQKLVCRGTEACQGANP